eukprot:840390_1
MSVIKNPCKIYIGNIPRDADEKQIEKMFEDIGSFLSLEFKGDFAFVEYGNSEASEEAIRKYDGVRVRGRRLIVEPFGIVVVIQDIDVLHQKILHVDNIVLL